MNDNDKEFIKELKAPTSHHFIGYMLPVNVAYFAAMYIVTPGNEKCLFQIIEPTGTKLALTFLIILINLAVYTIVIREHSLKEIYQVGKTVLYGAPSNKPLLEKIIKIKMRKKGIRGFSYKLSPAVIKYKETVNELDKDNLLMTFFAYFSLLCIFLSLTSAYFIWGSCVLLPDDLRFLNNKWFSLLVFSTVFTVSFYLYYSGCVYFCLNKIKNCSFILCEIEKNYEKKAKEVNDGGGESNRRSSCWLIFIFLVIMLLLAFVAIRSDCNRSSPNHTSPGFVDA